MVGSKSDSSFRKQGQAWFSTTDLPSDVTVVVDSIAFHLHKFPLLSRCGLMEKLIKDDDVVHLDGLPGGSDSFVLVARFCYGVRFEITPANVVRLRSASVWLRMTEEYGGDGNLIAQTEGFISNVVLRSWSDCLIALRTLDLDDGDDGDEGGGVGFVERCVAVLGGKISGKEDHHQQQQQKQRRRCGTVLWNGISAGTRSVGFDWWYEDVSSLSFPIYKRLISVLESRELPPDLIAGSLMFYAKRYLPGLNRRHSTTPIGDADKLDPSPPAPVPAVLSDEGEQMVLIEEIETMLPISKGVLLVPTSFLAGMLRTVMILGANRRRESSVCLSNLERRIGLQLDHAGLEDLLLPNLSYSVETLYNVDSVHRIVNHFLSTDSDNNNDDIATTLSSSSLTPITTVGKLIDSFLAEIASDVNLKPSNFQSLAAVVPEYARPLDDGLYRAIDIYFKNHQWMKEPEKENLCKLLDCQKLSTEACTHAAQNDRLPVRMVVQVLFFEQLQLRSSIAGCFLVSSDNLLHHRRSSMVTPPLSEALLPKSCEVDDGGWSETVKLDMDNMCMRVAELERECWTMKQEIEKMGKFKSRWRSVQKKFGFKIKSQICSETNTNVFGKNKRN